MKLDRFVNLLVFTIFRNRPWVIGLFAAMTCYFFYSATQLQMDAGFTKNIPLNHPYMKTYLKHQKDFGGANGIMVAVRAKQGDIFTPKFFKTLKGVHDQLFFIPGVARASVQSVYSPSTRFTEVVEDGFSGGPVIPADFAYDESGLQLVKGNIEKAGIVGRLVANDYSAAMVRAQLQEFNPETGLKLNTLEFADKLEDEIRKQFVDQDIDIHIIGFAKAMGDVAEGAKGVVVFFGVSLLITAVMVYLFSRSLMLTILPLLCSLMAVIWQLGALPVIGFGLDPMSILVPFLVFAIGVSHGVQMINAVGKNVARGMNAKAASQSSFRRLLVPGGVALLSDTIGFMTILSIDIGIIRELAITASIGVAVIILTNLILLPVLLSYIRFKPAYIQQVKSEKSAFDGLWAMISLAATPKVARGILVVTLLLFVAGYWKSTEMQIGDLQAGTPTLKTDSRYNQDTFLISDKFAITTDVLTVITETEPEACAIYEHMQTIDQFQWRIDNVAGVQSVISLPTLAKLYNSGFNEGNPKWQVLPPNSAALVQAISQVPSSTGLLNGNCSVMPVYVFLNDHKAGTIERVVEAVKVNAEQFSNDNISFKLASGPAGVMAAKNEAVEAAQLPMMIYVYSAVFLLCLISFRSFRATIAVILPLYVVSTLAQALMTMLDIGLTVSTLPVIALGVGIGVDYGIYILSTMSPLLNQRVPVFEAYKIAIRERGSAVLFTGITLAVGVSTWLFSQLQFQIDMGIMLTFMFLVNMLAAILVLPALTTLFWRNQLKMSVKAQRQAA